MTAVKVLDPQLTNEKISRMVTKACKNFADTNALVGSVTNYQINGAQVTSKLWGFNSNRSAMVVEVAINNEVIDKVEYKRSRNAEQFEQRFNCNFAYVYKLKTGQQLRK